MVVTGLTGAGKTELLARLAAEGEQVLDLEALARHRGSAFGRIGIREPQPSHDEFAGTVARTVATADPARPLWVEHEGPFIGSVGVPPWLVAAMDAAPAVHLDPSRAERVARLAATYGDADRRELLAALARSRRRLGAEREGRASRAVRAGDIEAAIDAVLPWFDAAYLRRMDARGRARAAA